MTAIWTWSKRDKPGGWFLKHGEEAVLYVSRPGMSEQGHVLPDLLNAHDALVAACEVALEHEEQECSPNSDPAYNCAATMALIRAAVSLARGAS